MGVQGWTDFEGGWLSCGVLQSDQMPVLTALFDHLMLNAAVVEGRPLPVVRGRHFDQPIQTVRTEDVDLTSIPVAVWNLVHERCGLQAAGHVCFAIGLSGQIVSQHHDVVRDDQIVFYVRASLASHRQNLSEVWSLSLHDDGRHCFRAVRHDPEGEFCAIAWHPVTGTRR